MFLFFFWDCSKLNDIVPELNAQEDGSSLHDLGQK